MRQDIYLDTQLSAADMNRLVQPAAQALAAGKLVAFPTETVYGLGANALDETAVHGIFTAKGRPSDNPLIVHVSSTEQVHSLTTSVPPLASTLMEHFWPGPLTLVLPKSELVPDIVTAGGSTVAIRMPSHPVALALIEQAGVPIAAPSANRSGRPSPTQADHVREDLGHSIAYLLDAGATQVGLESTVIDLSGDTPTLLRSGGLPLEKIEALIGPVLPAETAQENEPPKSPGQKYRHYAPRAQVMVVPQITADLLASLHQNGSRLAVVGLTQQLPPEIQADEVYRFKSVEDLAQGIFSTFRQCDEHHIDLIVVAAVAETGLGRAIMNRLQRASQNK